MLLSDLTDINLINANLNSNTKREVIEEMVDMFEKFGIITERDNFIEAVLNREKECTTGFGKGIAIPHGKSDSVKKSCFAIGKCKGVQWDSLDGQPVELVILIAVPKSKASTEHLFIISRLAEELMDDRFTNKLKNASSNQEIFEILEGIGIN